MFYSIITITLSILDKICLFFNVKVSKILQKLATCFTMFDILTVMTLVCLLYKHVTFQKSKMCKKVYYFCYLTLLVVLVTLSDLSRKRKINHDCAIFSKSINLTIYTDIDCTSCACIASFSSCPSKQESLIISQ